MLEGTRLEDGDPCKAVHVPPVWGVAPQSLEQHYQLFGRTPPPAGTTWRCQANNQSLLLERVNDDYCDCGDDEPTTSACAGAAGHRGFWCANVGYVGNFVPASRVADGAARLHIDVRASTVLPSRSESILRPCPAQASAIAATGRMSLREFVPAGALAR
eukprot:SAG11_NODE_4581_length_1844_cov_1.598281_1_plen_159_part_00